MKKKKHRNLAITRALNATASLRQYLVDVNGMTREEAKDATKHYYKTFKTAFEEGYKAGLQNITE